MKSMTGFGQASWQGKGCKINVEVRSVNQRFLEARFNLPREYAAVEAGLRERLQGVVARGKVDVTVTRSGLSDTDYAVDVNTRLARAYVEGWRRLQTLLRLDGKIDLSVLLARPDIVRIVERRHEPTAELRRVEHTFQRALQAFDREREREGRALARDMQQRIARLFTLRRDLHTRAGSAAADVAARLRQRIETIAAGVNVTPERLAQEVAVLASRADVTEELVRLESHLTAMREAVRSRETVGKRIDFLLQELHREVNTIASKSNDLQITNLTLAARAEIEKLREQVQNVE
jgi:uncharacterized protein (TIGR00255 family)